jgi:hypothetical protein
MSSASNPPPSTCANLPFEQDKPSTPAWGAWTYKSPPTFSEMGKIEEAIAHPNLVNGMNFLQERWENTQEYGNDDEKTAHKQALIDFYNEHSNIITNKPEVFEDMRTDDKIEETADYWADNVEPKKSPLVSDAEFFETLYSLDQRKRVGVTLRIMKPSSSRSGINAGSQS